MGYYVPLFSSSCLFTRPSSPSVRSRSCFSTETSVVRVAAANSDACLFTWTFSVRLMRMLFDPLFGLSFRTPNKASRATVYIVIFSCNFITYLKACLKASAGFGHSALGGLDLLDHHTHKSTVFFNNGSASKRFQQSVRCLWMDRGHRWRRLTPLVWERLSA